jgi:aspartate carbamoyltransferase catalytic subunit
MNIISCKQFEKREDIQDIFDITEKLSLRLAHMNCHWLASPILWNKTMASLFYEPSTRTRFSFETAMHRLGGNVISTENASQFSSHAKGESLEDTLAVIGRYADVIVLRHPDREAAYIADRCAKVPVINAGNGDGEHPTQALLDVFTIQKSLGSVDNKKIVLAGDLKYGRTIHSLIHLLSLYDNINLHLVSPVDLSLSNEYKDICKNKGIKFTEWQSLKECLSNNSVDVIYMTRIQKERHETLTQRLRTYPESWKLGETEFNMSGEAVIMHPLPRNDEINSCVDQSKRALYFTTQIDCGIAIRAGLLYSILFERN